MFSRKTRKGLLGGVALLLAGVMAGEARAKTEFVITPDFCESYNGMMFLMRAFYELDKDTDRVAYLSPSLGHIRLKGLRDLRGFDRLAIISPDSCGNINGWENSTVAEVVNLWAQSSGTLNSISSITCQPLLDDQDNYTRGSLVYELSRVIKGNVEVRGWHEQVLLASDGENDLTKAILTSDFYLKEMGAEADFLRRSNMSRFWDTVKFPFRHGTSTLKEYCQETLNGPDQHDEEEMRKRFKEVLFTSIDVYGSDILDKITHTSFSKYASLLYGTKNSHICYTDDNSVNPTCQPEF